MKYDFRKIAENRLDLIWEQAEAFTKQSEGDKVFGHITTEQRFLNLISPNELLAVAVLELCDLLKKQNEHNPS